MHLLHKIGAIDNSLSIITISNTHLNKLLSLLINNLEISFDKDFIYEKFSIEENERSKVVVQKIIPWNGMKIDKTL